MSQAAANRAGARVPSAPPPFLSTLANSLEIAATFVVALTLGLAPLGSGQPPNDPETGLNNSLACLAFALWSISRLLKGETALPPLRLAALLGLWALFFSLAACRVIWEPYSGRDFGLGLAPLADGDGQAALDLATAWFAHLLLFIVIFDLKSDHHRWRLFFATLVAGAAAVALYGLYQRGWGLPYFREFFQENPLAAHRTAGGDAAAQRALALRIASDRVYGPFGYQNALAGYLLIFLPGCFGLMQGSSTRRSLLALASLICLTCLLFSGSKAAFLAAKAIEVTILVWLMPRRSLIAALEAIAAVMLLTLLAGGSALAAAKAIATLVAGNWSRTFAEIVFALIWAFEIWWLSARARQGKPLPPWAFVSGLGLAIAALADEYKVLMTSGVLPQALLRAKEEAAAEQGDPYANQAKKII
ncbi:MAG: hypothetical protein N3A66_01200, partial [Planctomycetota bacterium]|nr:hypothetical protein [Planctomycetota bacterium]